MHINSFLLSIAVRSLSTQAQVSTSHINIDYIFIGYCSIFSNFYRQSTK